MNTDNVLLTFKLYKRSIPLNFQTKGAKRDVLSR